MTMGEEQQHSSHIDDGVHHRANQHQEQLIGSSAATAAAAVLSADNSDDNSVNGLSPSLPDPPFSPPSPPARSQSRTVPSRDWRRRSADVGGLHLATMGLGQGQGWMGGDPLPIELRFPSSFLGFPDPDRFPLLQDNLCRAIKRYV